MAEAKYGKYVKKAPTLVGDFPPKAKRMVMDSQQEFQAGNIGIRYSYFYGEPFQFEFPHEHDYDQYLCFLGTPEDVSDFDAEVEIWLGKEMEKHTMTEATVVYVPAGLTHTPMNFKRMSKPVLLINITASGEYIKKVEGKQVPPAGPPPKKE